MAHYQFHKDLKLGEQAQQEVIARLTKKIPGFKHLGDNKTNAFDFQASIDDGDPFVVEVKWDLKSALTGNVAIEYESRGKLSGIAATQAKIWVYKYVKDNKERFRAIYVDTLREMLYNTHTWRTTTGGDRGSNTMMFLVPLGHFEQWGISL
jgi:hypothetical protein